MSKFDFFNVCYRSAFYFKALFKIINFNAHSIIAKTWTNFNLSNALYGFCREIFMDSYIDEFFIYTKLKLQFEI